MRNNFKSEDLFSSECYFKLNLIFYIFGLACNGLGFYYSGKVPGPNEMLNNMGMDYMLCHIITGIGFVLNAICCFFAFFYKKYILFGTIAILFSGYILFPTIMLTANNPTETILYQFVLPAIYSTILTKKYGRVIITSLFNMAFLAHVDWIQFRKFEGITVSTAATMVVIFIVVYLSITAVVLVFANALDKSLTNEIKLKDRYRDIARTDPLTGLYNRFGLSEKLLDEPATAVMFDIDNFKSINDTFGHPVGDKVLVEIAKVFKQYATNKFIVSRHGGEEFLVVSYLSEKETIRKCEVIRNQVSLTISIPDSRVLTLSAGSSSRNSFSESLITEADNCLYKSKNTGKNKLTMYNEVDN